MAAKKVKSPDGDEWVLRRCWMDRRVPRLRWQPIGIEAAEEDAAEKLPAMDFNDDLLWAMVAAVVAYAVILIALPLAGVSFGYVLLLFLLVSGAIGSDLMLRPWIVQAANRTDPKQSAAFPVKGWRRADEAIEAIALEIEKSGLPKRIPVQQY